jgi:hypothetical protein
MTDGQWVSLGWYQASIWEPRPNFLLLSLIIFKQLRICWCGAPSLTTSRVCSFQFFAAHRQSSFSQVWAPRDLWAYFIVSVFEIPPTWRARFLYLIPPGTGWPSYTPGHWVFAEYDWCLLRLKYFRGQQWRFFPLFTFCNARASALFTALSDIPFGRIEEREKLTVLK